MKKLLQGIRLLTENLRHLKKKDEVQLLALGRLLSNQQSFVKSTNLSDFEFKIFSQWGDDGIIQFLIKNLDIQNRTFIEFGVEDYSESNTRFLLKNDNWSGFVIDGSKENIEKIRNQSWFWKYELTTKNAFIDKDNINSLLQESGFSNVGILSVDIDGNDYHRINTIDFNAINPSILIAEYNSIFGNVRPITVPYRKYFLRTKAHFTNLFFGASLPALVYLAEEKGYSLVGCTLSGNNAYFVRNDLLTSKIQKIDMNEAFKKLNFEKVEMKIANCPI